VPAARRNRLKPANAIPITKRPVEPSNPWPVTLPVNSHLASQLACGEGVAATGLHDPATGNQRRFLTGSKRVWHRSPTI
jgi:hypothetical protein